MSTDRDPGAEDAVGNTFTPRIRLALIFTAILLVIWFFFAWLILERHILDAAGESVGTALALGVVASILGALRASR